MKQMVCEMCGNTNLVKQGGLFVCQYCGCKYSPEEAKKLMVEGIVKIDDSEELQKLYQAARNAREASDDASAIRHYEAISAKDPNSWEAMFFLVVLKTNEIKNGEINSAAISVSGCLPKVFELIAAIKDTKAQKTAVQTVVTQCVTTARWLTSASHSFCKSLTKGNGLMALTGVVGAIHSIGSTSSAGSEDQERCLNIANIMCYCGNYIEQYCDMHVSDYRNYAVIAWKEALRLNEEYTSFHKFSILFDAESVDRFTNKIKKYDSTFLSQKEKLEIQQQKDAEEKAVRDAKTPPCWALSVVALILSFVFPPYGFVLGLITTLCTRKNPEAVRSHKNGVIALVIGVSLTVLLGLIGILSEMG